MTEEGVVRNLMLDSWNQSIFSNIKQRLQVILFGIIKGGLGVLLQLGLEGGGLVVKCKKWGPIGCFKFMSV